MVSAPSVAVTLIGAVDQTARRSDVTADQKTQLDDLAAMFGMMSGVALFMAIFVVASTFGFVVAARRRELGMLRLIGATPRQVRRMVLGEAGVVALLAAVVGGLLGTALAPALPGLLQARGITDLRLELPPAWIAWAVAVPCAVGVALIGSWRASKRAAKVAPVAALHEAALERHRPGFWQTVVGIVCLAACLSGEVSLHLRQGKYDEARKSAEWFAHTFGSDGFWLEIQQHGIPEERLVAEGRLGKKSGEGFYRWEE